MSTAEANSVCSGAFADALARSGVREVCVSPGSRSTPLAVALAEHPSLRVWVIPDERSSAFFALGIGKATGASAALLCTSGTAAANYLPAIVEARYGRVPLIALTADRPHELRDRGAPQAIDQVKLYGDQVKWFAEVAPPEATDQMARYAADLAARAAAEACGAPPGPVHLNFPFREPFLPASPPAPVANPVHTAATWQGRLAPDGALVRRLAVDLARTPRGLIVCGPLEGVPGFADTVTKLSERLGYPVLADPLSQLRAGAHRQELVVDTADALLRAPGFVERHRPDAVLRFGAMPTSKPLTQLIQHCPPRTHVLMDDSGWRDPTITATHIVRSDPSLFCEALSAELGDVSRRDPWLRSWLESNRRAREAVAHTVGEIPETFEGRVFPELRDLLPPGSVLFAGNSMPVRDLDSFFFNTPTPVRVMANRGASGIDGVTSTALGVSAASGSPVVLVTGDLSFYHDLNGLIASKLYGVPLTVVLVHNDGGGIFSFLPQASQVSEFERLFGTPHGLDFRPVVEMYGGTLERPRSWEDFRRAVREGIGGRGVCVVELRTDRALNVGLHRRVWCAVESALEAER